MSDDTDDVERVAQELIERFGSGAVNIARKQVEAAASAPFALFAGQNERIGGSRAQQDLIEFTLLKAYLNANRLDEARRLLSIRRPGASGIPVEGIAAVQ
jgi:hypothetical protein